MRIRERRPWWHSASRCAARQRFVVETPLIWFDKTKTWAMAEKLGREALVEIIREAIRTAALPGQGRRSVGRLLYAAP
jgi:hypothetical protein